MTKKDNTIAKIHQFQRFGSILGLERMTELLKLLGNPQDELKVIHGGRDQRKGFSHADIYTASLEKQDIKQEYIFPRLLNPLMRE